MRTKRNWLLTGVVMVVASALMFLTRGTGSEATYTDYLDTLNAGAALIIDADITMNTDDLKEYIESVNGGTEKELTIEDTPETEEAELVMANIKNSLNVREEPSGDSKRVGKLYAECGGVILERQDGWTKLKSGNVVGWCSDNYLLFGDDAETLAREVGEKVAVVLEDGLRIRGEAGSEGVTYGFVNKDDVLTVTDAYEDGDDWVSITFDETEAYVSSDYVVVEILVDSGETVEESKEREALEEAERLARVTDYGEFSASEWELTLLASIIYCEAGNQSYDGKVAVGAVVLNRLENKRFPDTIEEVIYQKNQFSPAGSGFLARILDEEKATESCYEAAKAALSGESPIGDCLFFRRTGTKEGQVIGDHVFY